MKTDNDLTPDTLAMLAAQSRFAKLPTMEAVRAAMELRRAAEKELARGNSPQEPTSQALERPQEKPTNWPGELANRKTPEGLPAVPFHVFLSRVVRGRDEADSEKKFMEFLPEHLLNTALSVRDPFEKAAREKIAEIRKRGEADKEEKAIQEAIAGLRDEFRKELATTKAKRLVARWKKNGVDEPAWNWLASPYRNYWDKTGRFAGKKAGGKKAAEKRAEKRTEATPATASQNPSNRKAAKRKISRC